MGCLEGKSVWLDCPYFADVFEGCEALEGLQSPPVIIGIDEVVEVGGQLRVTVIMVSLDGSFLDCPVHPFDLAVGPWVLDLGEPVLDSVFLAPHVEHVGHPCGCRAVGIARREGELDAVVGQHGVDFVGYRDRVKSGINGSFAFLHPASGRIIVGTTNQIEDRARPYCMMVKAALAG